MDLLREFDVDIIRLHEVGYAVDPPQRRGPPW